MHFLNQYCPGKTFHSFKVMVFINYFITVDFKSYQQCRMTRAWKPTTFYVPQTGQIMRRDSLYYGFDQMYFSLGIISIIVQLYN